MVDFYSLSKMTFVFILFTILLLVTTSTASAAPGDQYVFGADSAVAPDGVVSQNLAAISGDNVVWMGHFNYNGTWKDRVYYKDISNPENQAAMLVPKLESNQDQGEPVISGSLVVWLEGGMDKEIHYTYLGANCPGACVDNVITLPDLNPWELAVRGHKIVFQNERSGTHNTDIYLYDLDNPGSGAVPITTALENQTNPDISDTWISWADDSTGQTEIHAKRIDGTEERIIEGPINYGHALGGDNLVFARGSLRDPDVGVWLLDLGDPTSEPTRLSDMEGVRPDIDADSNDKVVWDSATPRSAPRQVYLHDLTSGETQQVSTTPETSLAFMSVISNTHIVWSDDRAAVRNLYENELGDTAYALAVRYAPHLYLHKEEYFEPRPVGIFVDGEGTRLRERRSSGDITLHEWPDLYLGTLGQYTSANDQPGIINGGKYIDLPGSVLSSRISHWVFDNNYIKRYDGLINQYQYPELYYAKVVRNSTGDGVAIQYWIPYYFNNFDNYHEGDWEMVQVNLEDDLDDLMPRSVALSQHLGGIKASWQYIDHDQTGYHPVIYVARGSHANYFAAGEYPVVVENWFDATDHTEVNNPIHEPQVTVLPNVNSSQIGSLVPGPYSWLAYQGAWGEMVGGGIGFDGPQGPAATPEHSDSWDDPFTWSEGLCDNGDPQCAGVYYDDSYGSVASPVDIHLYDVAGNHVGKNETGGIDEQVPGAEYIEIPELHRKTIIIHGGDASAGYRFVLEGTGVGTFNFTIASPDRANNSSDVVDYVDVPVTASTQVELNLGKV